MFGAIWLHDEAAGGLRCRTVWHPAAEGLAKFAELSRSKTFAKGKGLPGRVWDSRKPTWIYDVTRDPNFPRAPAAAEADLRGAFAFPLFIERRRIQRELQREKENAEAANAAKDRFLATLSHELRTPLTPVLIWAGGTANQPGLSPKMQQGLKMVCRNVELEARLIDDLLDLTRISRGKLQLQLRPAVAHELLRDALEIVRSDRRDAG